MRSGHPALKVQLLMKGTSSPIRLGACPMIITSHRRTALLIVIVLRIIWKRSLVMLTVVAIIWLWSPIRRHLPWYQVYYSYTYTLMGNEIYDEFDNVNPDEVNLAQVLIINMDRTAPAPQSANWTKRPNILSSKIQVKVRSILPDGKLYRL